MTYFENFWWEYKIWKNNLEAARLPIDLSYQGTGYDEGSVVNKGYCVQTVLGKHYQWTE